MIILYHPNSTATTPDYTYDGTASWDYERWYEDEDDLFYIEAATYLAQDAYGEKLAEELRRFETLKHIKQLGRIAFYFKWRLPHKNMNRRPLNLYRKILRCNRHGLGLRIRRDR